MSTGLKLAEAGHELIKAGRPDLAWQAIDLALAVAPDIANAHTLRAHLLELRGDFPAAMTHWRRAAELVPDSPGHRFNLALGLLRDVRLGEGFAQAEARLEKTDWSSLAAKGSFAGLLHRVPRPGEDLSGKRVLAFTEQGLGDNIWAARWLPVLGLLAGALDLACRPALRPLLAGLVPGTVLAPPEGEGGAKLNLAALAGKYESFVPLMSLPWLLGVTVAEAETWLVPNRDKVAEWRARYLAAMPGAKRIVGVVWRANPESESAGIRFVPPESFIGLEGLVNLQGGAVEGRALPGAFDPLAAGEPPLDDYAAMIAATDILLTADTMAAHLAGSMGHPAVVAVPSVPNFYWGVSGDRSPWYRSLHLVRQATGADWRDATAEMAALAR